MWSKTALCRHSTPADVSHANVAANAQRAASHEIGRQPRSQMGRLVIGSKKTYAFTPGIFYWLQSDGVINSSWCIYIYIYIYIEEDLAFMSEV
jgi:hypothetical protein